MAVRGSAADPTQIEDRGSAAKRKRRQAFVPAPRAGKKRERTDTRAQAPLSYMAVYRASPLERIDMIRCGVPAALAKHIFADLRLGQGAALRAMNLSTATVNKKAKHSEILSPEESERIIGFARLVGQVEAIIEDSGEPAGFDAGAWMAGWLMQPLRVLGGMRPADLLDTMEGQGLVADLLGKMQSGAYA